MAVKIETVKEKIEKDSNEFISDENVSSKLKTKFNELGNEEEDLRKKYQLLSNWKSRINNKENTVKSETSAEVADVKNIFKEIKKMVNPNNPKLFEVIFNQTKDLLQYIETSEERQLIKEEERIEREIAEKTKLLEEIKTRKKSLEKTVKL
ncbi:hypothetical protein EZS27_016882 [termite gut metagenome]|uniref:Uncharacterized protein n=1 Tax=termite gut metagenome TaxID=433724 RepID=A0A5J4RNX4_9ZZZZ